MFKVCWIWRLIFICGCIYWFLIKEIFWFLSHVSQQNHYHKLIEKTAILCIFALKHILKELKDKKVLFLLLDFILAQRLDVHQICKIELYYLFIYAFFVSENLFIFDLDDVHEKWEWIYSELYFCVNDIWNFSVQNEGV